MTDLTIVTTCATCGEDIDNDAGLGHCNRCIREQVDRQVETELARVDETGAKARLCYLEEKVQELGARVDALEARL